MEGGRQLPEARHPAPASLRSARCCRPQPWPAAACADNAGGWDPGCRPLSPATSRLLSCRHHKGARRPPKQNVALRCPELPSPCAAPGSPSTGSTIQVGSSVSWSVKPCAADSSSPMNRCDGNAADRCACTSASHRLSVSVTRSTAPAEGAAPGSAAGAPRAGSPRARAAVPAAAARVWERRHLHPPALLRLGGSAPAAHPCARLAWPCPRRRRSPRLPRAPPGALLPGIGRSQGCPPVERSPC